jgi:hypothetical protein
MRDPGNVLSEEECHALFGMLFPHGFAAEDVLREIAPAGYEHSPLVAAFHPTVEQVYREVVQIQRNLRELFQKRAPERVQPEPTLQEVARDFRTAPIDTPREVRELVGLCLWDVFSDGHEVVDRTGRVADLGSFRGTGGFLAEVLNRQLGEARYDYIDFYMGTTWLAQRADLTAVYAMVFRRLRQQGFDWIYHFPRLYAVDFRPLKEALDEGKEPDWANYDPSLALAKEAAEQEHDRHIAELRASLDEGHREAVEAALDLPPPTTVQAYRAVYGRFPRGWPPVPS